MSLRAKIHDTAASVLNSWGRERHRRHLRVLMFHGLTNREHEGLENCQHKHMHVARFEALAAHLADSYTVLSMDELVGLLAKGAALPPCPVVLTFDDGFASNYHLAYPILRHYRLSATVYLATRFVDEKIPIWVDRVDFAMQQAGRKKVDLVGYKNRLKSLPHEEILAEVSKLEAETGHWLEESDSPAIYRPLNWDQVREMAASGLVSFGSHTHGHIILGRASAEVMNQELNTSREIIERETGQPCHHFCYPNGTPDDFSELSEQIVREHGFRSTITTVGGLNDQPISPFLLRRLGMTNDLRPKQIEQYLAVGDASLKGILGAR